MSNAFFISLAPGAQLINESSDDWTVVRGGQRLSLTNMNPFVASAVREIASRGAREDDLVSRILDSAGLEGVSEFYVRLGQLWGERLLCHSVCIDGFPIAACVPLSASFQFSAKTMGAEDRYVLSRFALCRRDGREWILESPRVACHVVLHDPRALSILGRIAAPCLPEELAANSPDLPADVCELVGELLYSAGFLVKVDEDIDPAFEQWEFHDLFFHSRSRAGRHANPYGGTFRFRDEAGATSAVKPPMSGDCTELYRPDIEELKQADASLTSILESRRSIRNYGATPMTVRQLGEFLYRSARVSNVFNVEGWETSTRVYPGGGSAYELEVYPVIDRCEGLESGLYQYCPQSHQLCRISGRTADVDFLLTSAAQTARSARPQILLVITARFQRVTWKYSSTAYALILKDVGVLFQTMYLAATAMGLAPCALGGGNSDVFANATGLDYFREASVGEFILGSSGRRS